MKKLLQAVLILFFISLFSTLSFASVRALLVGISDYQALPASSRKGKSDLRGAVNDVRAIQSALVSSYGFSKNDIRVLLNKEATRKSMEKAFDEWLVNGTEQGDLVVFYFSGHGSSVKDYNGDEEDGYDEVLCPYDMMPHGGYNIIVDDELALWLRRLKGKTAVVIIDSCHSGGAVRGIRGRTVTALEDSPAWRSRFVSITDYQPSATAMGIPRGSDVPESVIFMAASRENEAALEVNMPQGFYGGFSFGLFNGMNRLHTASYERLFEHARRVVKDRLKLPQEPQIIAKKDIVVSPAFGIHKPAPSPDVVNVPVAPPEIVGEKVLVAVETLEKASKKEMKRLKEGLGRLPIVELAKEDAFFDRLIRGEKVDGRYHVRLLNRIGDVERIEPAGTMKELVGLLSQQLEYAFMVKQLARIHHPNPAFKVKAWVIDDTRRDFRLGEKIVFGLESERDCYVILTNLDSEGNFHVIFPNKYHQNNFVRANTTVLIPGEKMRAGEFELQFGAPAGEETVKVIATTRPLKLASLGLGDFQEAFQTLSEKTGMIFVKKVITTLSSDGFDWSEDTVVIRSHD